MKLRLATAAAAAALTLSLPALAATEIQWWHAMTGANNEVVETLAKEFNDSQADYKVVPVFKGTYPETLNAGIAAFRAGQPPHILQVFDAGTGTMMAASSAVVPVAKVLQADGVTFDKSQYLGGVNEPSRVDPASWVYDQAKLDRPGNVEIQLDLFYDYRTNVELYPRFHAFFRERRPPTLIVWGKNDEIFPAPGALAYRKDLPDAELHLIDSGHFALEDQGTEIAALMRDFLGRKVK